MNPAEHNRDAGRYEPEPIDTAEIELAPEFEELVARLAENVHANWAEQRISEGWRYGPSRDDERKEHPSLISYFKLSEAEKEYDRIAVTQTLKAIFALGYRLVKS